MNSWAAVINNLHMCVSVSLWAGCGYSYRRAPSLLHGSSGKAFWCWHRQRGLPELWGDAAPNPVCSGDSLPPASFSAPLSPSVLPSPSNSHSTHLVKTQRSRLLIWPCTTLACTTKWKFVAPSCYLYSKKSYVQLFIYTQQKYKPNNKI